jgi:hypothetical protein
MISSFVVGQIILFSLVVIESLVIWLWMKSFDGEYRLRAIEQDKKINAIVSRQSAQDQELREGKRSLEFLQRDFGKILQDRAARKTQKN